MAVGHVQTEFCTLFTFCMPNLLFRREEKCGVIGMALPLIMEAKRAEDFSLSTTV